MNVGDAAVQDHRDSRGDQRGDHGGGGGDDGGKLLGEAFLFHLRHQHLGFHCGVRQVGAGQTAHQRGQQDVHLGQTAGQAAGDRGAEVHDPVGDAGVVHEHAGTYEERYG